MTLDFQARLQLGALSYAASFQVRDEIVVLFGHSGAGKSLTLQLVAGLLRPQEGRIVIDGHTVLDTSAGICLPPQQRHVGYVVQNLALFPHLSVARNIAFGIPAGTPRGPRVRDLLRLFGLQGLEDRLPGTLSGGQQQRVALARALARDARLLLLDEPFSALDESLRESMRRELVRLRGDLGLSIVFVTHDLREAHLLADRLAVFDAGSLLQLGPREHVFRRPANRRVAELTGVGNILAGRVVARGNGTLTVDAGGVRLECPAPGGEASFAPGALVDVAIRAERVNLRRGRAAGLGVPNVVDAEIAEELAYGSIHILRMRPVAGGPPLTVEIAARPYEVLGVAAQRTWAVELPRADLHVMPA